MNKFNEQQQANKTDKAEKVTKTSATDGGKKSIQVTAGVGSKTKWPQQIKAAKNQWGKLSESELLHSDGNPQQLASLVQKRYDIARDVADKQVKSFLDKCNMA